MHPVSFFAGTKTRLRTYTVILFLFLSGAGRAARPLEPGFVRDEYRELLLLTARNGNAEVFPDMAQPQRFRLSYRSAEIGLDNRWELWVSGDTAAAISIRGSTRTTLSWLANIYAAMVPAAGSMVLADNDTFSYSLSAHPAAAVHVGWMLATAYLSRDMLPRIDSACRAGIRDYYITGHSQGGGIAFLITAYLYSLRDEGRLPPDIRFKTYASAAPKPGNLYFAYDYEKRTQQGWAYNVVNADDWVPEVPLSVQTVDDFNEVSPFYGVYAHILKVRFPRRLILKRVYNKLSKPPRKAQRAYQKYLGNRVSGIVKGHISEFSTPDYYPSNNYVRTGITIVLKGDAAYYEKFPLDKEKIFGQHMPDAYLYLADRLEMP